MARLHRTKELRVREVQKTKLRKKVKGVMSNLSIYIMSIFFTSLHPRPHWLSKQSKPLIRPSRQRVGRELVPQEPEEELNLLQTGLVAEWGVSSCPHILWTYYVRA